MKRGATENREKEGQGEGDERKKLWVTERDERVEMKEREAERIGRGGESFQALYSFFVCFSGFHFCGCIYRHNLDGVGEVLKL